MSLTTHNHAVDVDSEVYFLTKPVDLVTGENNRKPAGLTKLVETSVPAFSDNQKAKYRQKLESIECQASDPNKPVIIVARGEHGDVLVGFSANVQIKSADGKLGQDLTMRTGASCFSCDLSLEQLHDPEIIKQGMSMNFLTVDANKVFENIAREKKIPLDNYDDFYVPSEDGDWSRRFGIKGRPISKELEVSRISAVLHRSTLRILTWFNNLGIRHLSKAGWGRGHRFSEAERKRFESCTLEWKLLLGDVAGYRNKPCPNQMTGYLAGRLFAEDQRDKFVDKIAKLWEKFRREEMSDTLKTIYKELLQRFAVIRRVVAADRCIKVVEFFYCLDTYLFILVKFSWALISDSLHMLLAHSWEHIVLNQNMGLASESEQPVECSHRARREERLHLARKTDLMSNLLDTFRAGWISGDSGVKSLDRKPVCSRCQTIGDHWTMGCPKKCPPQQLLPNSDTVIVNSFFCDVSDQPHDQVALAERLFSMDDEVVSE